MSNIIRLLGYRKNEDPSGLETGATTAVANILASSVQLGHRVKELATHLDAVDQIIDALDDSETRIRLRQSTKLNREALTNATHILTREIEKVPELRIWTGRTRSNGGR